MLSNGSTCTRCDQVSAYHGSLADAMHIEEEKRVPLARVDGNNSGGSNPGGSGREGEGAGGGGGGELDGREYGWDAADVKAMQKQYEEFLKASKVNKWWSKGDEEGRSK